MSEKAEVRELTDGLASYWEALATSRSSHVQQWSAGDLQEAYRSAETVEERYKRSDEDTRERMREAMLILCECGGDLERTAETDFHPVLDGATTSLLVELLRNSFLPMELLSKVLIEAESKRSETGDGDICFQRVIDTISLQIYLNSVESICRASYMGHTGSQVSVDCQRRACERVMRRRWRNALRLGEEQEEDIKETIREYLQLYPSVYCSLLIGMLSPSAVDCVREDAADVSHVHLTQDSIERERQRYDDELTNLSIVRFFEGLIVGEDGLYVWEKASWPVVSSACHTSEDFLKFFLSTITDLLSAQDTAQERKDRAIACVRHIAGELPSRPQRAAKELLELLWM